MTVANPDDVGVVDEFLRPSAQPSRRGTGASLNKSALGTESASFLLAAEGSSTKSGTPQLLRSRKDALRSSTAIGG